MKVKLTDMTLKEVRDEGKIEVAVIGWGATEPHNLHIPYGCDAFTVERVAEISALKAKNKGAKVIVLPAMYIGTNSNHFGFPMVMHFSPSTQQKMLADILWSLENSGIKKLLIINGHGGNEFKGILREFYGKTGVQIFLSNWWLVREDVINDVTEDKSGEHGNEFETSCCMHFFPELVRLEWADEGKVREPRISGMKNGQVWMTRPWPSLTTNAGHGNPMKSTPEKGKKIIDAATDALGDIIKEISDVVIDEKFPY